MQSWKAYIELKKKIDDFNETCPLLQLMTSRAMKDRHWQRMEEIMNYNFDVDNPKTTLGKIMLAPLLQYKEDVLVTFNHSLTIFLQLKLEYIGHLYWRRKGTRY